MKTRNMVGLVVAIALLFAGAMASARMSPRKIYKTKGPGVVLIVASQQGSSSASAGTGSIIHKDGIVITNSHVIFDAKAKAPYPVIHVFLKPDKVTGNMNKDLTRHYSAEVLAYDNALDLALVKMKKAPPDLTVITIGDPDELGPGDETIAIGHPEQGGLWTITTGVIGAQFENFKGVPGKHVFQMDTSLNRGNSGGPLFDVRGYQVGVNTAIARKGQGGIAITGVNFEGATQYGLTAAQFYSTASYQQDNLDSLTLNENDLAGWDFSGNSLRDTSFDSSDLSGADFHASDLSSADLRETNLVGANLQGVLAPGASFTSADLTGVDLSNVDLTDASFSTAALSRLLTSSRRSRNIRLLLDRCFVATPSFCVRSALTSSPTNSPFVP